MPIIQGRLAEGRQPLIKVTISNDTGVVDDSSPPLQERTVWALLDTGATSGALDELLCKELSLESLGMIEFLGAGMDHPIMVTRYGCSLSIFHDHRETRRTEWPDMAFFAGVGFSGRPYRAVIGMDMIMKGKLTIENEGQAIRFEY